jgi:hypothetical protein
MSPQSIDDTRKLLDLLKRTKNEDRLVEARKIKESPDSAIDYLIAGENTPFLTVALDQFQRAEEAAKLAVSSHRALSNKTSNIFVWKELRMLWASKACVANTLRKMDRFVTFPPLTPFLSVWLLTILLPV